MGKIVYHYVMHKRKVYMFEYRMCTLTTIVYHIEEFQVVTIINSHIRTSSEANAASRILE
jgi:hypothetical protein